MADNDFYSNSKVDGQYWTAQDVENVEKGFELLEDATASILEKDVSGGTDVTLTSTAKAVSEERYAIHVFTGTLTGNINIIVSTAEQVYRVFNNTSGAYTLTMKTSAGTGITIPQGEKMAMYCDGTNVVDRETAFSTLNVGDSVQIDGVVDEDDMVSDSPTKVATQQSTKKYIDDEVGAVDSDLTAHLDDTEDAHDASAISSVAVGNVTSQDVQSAIEELDTQDTDHAALTEAHGATGAVMGTTNTQTVTNKTLDALSNLIGANHIHVKVRNTTAGALGKGTVVKATGYNLGQDCVEVAATAATSDVAFGVLNEELAVNTNGLAVNTGVVESVDTSSFSVGNKLYSDGAGSFTTTKPSSGLYQTCAFVLRSHANNGRLFVEFTEQLDADGEIKLGHITVSQAVDLDAIEASADVTDTANVTASGALMDSEVTNLAQVKAFDTTDYATSTQGTTADNALPLAGGAMTGAITTNSTFDGRDVATDGAKLDAIEAAADVTDTTNVTAAGALMDSEVTNLAQVKAFDTTAYATAAQGTTADAALPKAGGTMTGTIAGFTSTGIDDNATSTKLTVADTGIDVAGGFTATDGSTITVTDNSDVLTLISTDSDLNSGPRLALTRNSGSPSDDDYIGLISFNGKNSADEDVRYGLIRTRVLDVTDGTEDSELTFWSRHGGSETIKLATTSTGIDVTGSVTCDGFTSTGIDDNATSTAITIDASERVNMSTGSSGATAHVAADELVVEGSGSAGISILTPNTSSCSIRFGDPEDGDAGKIIYDHTTNGMGFSTSGTERVSVTDNGLTFNGDTAAANALDDYEEGTWTPTVSSGITSITYGTNTGTYTKVGNLVTFECILELTAGTLDAGDLKFGGMPFNAVGTLSAALFGLSANVGLANSCLPVMRILSIDIRCYVSGSGTTYKGTDLTSGLINLRLAGSYTV